MCSRELKLHAAPHAASQLCSVDALIETVREKFHLPADFPLTAETDLVEAVEPIDPEEFQFFLSRFEKYCA